MEKWQEYYTDDQIKKLQKIEFETLTVFITVCDKLGLEYFLYGGTLLGAVKYGDFIPWDDDIDVALPRESYDKFVHEAGSVLPNGYFIQSPYNCKNSPYPYIKLRKAGTKYVEYINRNLPIETGIYIDIYPVDKIPDNEKRRRKQFRLARRWILIYVYRQSRLFDNEAHTFKEHLKNAIKYVVCHISKVFSQKFCIKQIDKYMKMYNDNDNENCRYGALSSPNYNNIYDSIYPLKKGVFHGLEVNMPDDYLNHLIRRYGDINSLPPKEKRVGHIPYRFEC